MKHYNNGIIRSTPKKDGVDRLFGYITRQEGSISTSCLVIVVSMHYKLKPFEPEDIFKPLVYEENR